jgi:hypothetical protein
VPKNAFLKRSYPEPKEIKKNLLQFWEAKGVLYNIGEWHLLVT